MTTFWKFSKKCLSISDYSTTFATLWPHTTKLFYLAYILSYLFYEISIYCSMSFNPLIKSFNQPSEKGPSPDLCWPPQKREVHSYKECNLAHWHSSSTVIFRILCLHRSKLVLVHPSHTTISTSHFDNHMIPTQTPQLFESQLHKLTFSEIIQ